MFSIYYTIKKRAMMCTGRVIGRARAVGGQVECLEGHILADVFGLESGVITEGPSALFLYYNLINIRTRNTQLLSIYATLLLLDTSFRYTRDRSIT